MFNYILLFIVGLAFGSFASVIIHRLHTREGGILWGSSKCPKCSSSLAVRDLIPIVSFVVNKFRCRFCKELISWNYPILELVMGAAFTMTGWLIMQNGFWWLLFYLIVTFVFVLLAFYDIYFQEVPDVIIIPAIILSLIVIAATGLHGGAADFLYGIAIPLAFFGTLFLASKGEWLGGGDVRIGALIGILLGWPNILVGLFLSYLFGAVFSLIGIIMKKFHRKSRIPFAPFLFAGTYIAMFWGEKILEWYLGI